jgi:dTDP-glucose 4,6-dehydratase
MKLLITGGAGFMGSNFIHYILEKYPGYEIVNLDKLTYAGNLENLAGIKKNSNYQFFKGDITQKENIKKAIKLLGGKADAIINYAAETHVDRSIMDPLIFSKTNVIGTQQVLETVKEGQAQKLIHISTDEVFGEIEEGEFYEDSKLEPNSPYSASKAGGDLMARAYFKTYNLPVIVTHSCNFYGPYQYPEKFIPLMITNLLEGKKIPIYGDGTNVREWIYTLDHCRAIDKILHQGKTGEIYNIGSGERMTNLEVADLIVKLLKGSKEQIQFVKDRPGHDLRYAINCNKLINNLKFKPKIDFKKGIALTIDWYKKNQKWWKKLKNQNYEDYYQKQYQAK